MKSPILLFVGLSVASHATVMALGGGNTASERFDGGQIQVSLLSGRRQENTDRASSNSGHKQQAQSMTSGSSPAATSAGSTNQKPRLPDSRDESSAVSVPQSAITPSPGDRIARELHKLLAARFTYPALAVRLGHQGQVLVKVTISPDGTIAAATLERSSGHRTLDQAAIDSILGIHRVPHLQPWLQGRAVSINVPVTYRTIEA